jgi:Alpha/beta hydrolase of unknown function (DUF900)
LKQISQFALILVFELAMLMTIISFPLGKAQALPNNNNYNFSSIVSTRGHFSLVNGTLLMGHNEKDYSASNISGLQSGGCPNEIAIIVHGWALNENKANERFDRANMSLQHDNYHKPSIGFSWDANTTWTIAKYIAKENGLKLGQFIFDFKDKCPSTTVRVIAHSLGSRVVLSALESLHGNQEWKNKNFKISSVNLMGAAVDDEEVSKNPSYIDNNQTSLNNMSEWYDVYGIKSAYGKVIENEVSRFYNLFNPKDKALTLIYGKDEHDNALGLTGKQEGITIPSNYNQTNVQSEILALCDADGDGNPDLGLTDCTTVDIGDNHAGYFGFRNSTNHTFIDDGAMNIVVREWQQQTP